MVSVGFATLSYIPFSDERTWCGLYIDYVLKLGVKVFNSVEFMMVLIEIRLHLAMVMGRIEPCFFDNFDIPPQR